MIDKIAGSIAIIEASKEEAQLRWLLLHPDLRGPGIGWILLEDTISFCRDYSYFSIFLWTVSVLKIAAYLYASVGFKFVEEKTLDETWKNL